MEEKEYLYYLMHVPGIGAVSIFRLHEYFRSFRAAWTADEKEYFELGFLNSQRIQAVLKTRETEDRMKKEYERLKENKIRFVAYFEEEYPERLKPFHDRPAGLFVRGKLPEDGIPSAAIVGARNCTEYGRQTAYQIAEELSKAGIQIVSGLALGVDGAAHKGALDAKKETFAVLGCGINICYPKENYRIFSEIERDGGILSEFVPGTRPVQMNFPMRNRIISGLSDAVIVVEAREKSGSLITADLALEQGKEVFAVPGRIADTLSTGCNRLLQQGAVPCLGSGDVLEFFGMKYEKKLTLHKISEKRLAKKENMVYSCLDSRPRHLEEIVEICQLSVTESMECLLKLELMGLVQGDGNQYYCRRV